MRHLISVLFAPRETYLLLREKVDWVSPVLVLGLLTAMYEMIASKTEFTLSDVISKYGLSVMNICVGVFLTALVLFVVKSVLRAEAGTFRQLCKVKLFSLAPTLLYLLAKLTTLQIVGSSAVDETGIFVDSTLQVIDAGFGLLMTVWSVVLLVIGTAVMLERRGSQVLLPLASIWFIILAISLLF